MLSGAFHDAYRQFEALLSNGNADSVGEFEVELWEENRIETLAYLGQWQPVLDSILSSIDDPVTYVHFLFESVFRYSNGSEH